MKETKKIVILDNNHGQLANQLWSYMSVYAYCLERGYSIGNPSFGDYRKYFNLDTDKPFTDLIFYNRFKKSRLYQYLRPYHRYSTLVKKIMAKQVIESGGPADTIVHLPPSGMPEVDLKENSSYKKLYFCGGRFRNPVGIEKYREQIKSYFKPRVETANLIAQKFSEHRKLYKHIVGVHIRQTDFKTDGQGHFVSPKDFVARLKEYLSLNVSGKGYLTRDTLFIICSDEKINPQDFDGLNIYVNNGNIGEDLFTLANCDIIIGSNSTFGAFAAYYGNIPLIVVDNVPTDWEYYRGKNKYFENKYCTVVKY